MAEVKFPQNGIPRDQLMNELRSLKSGDNNWKEGRMFSLVFNAGEEVLSLTHEACSLFMMENGLSPFAFPSLLKMETEVAAMMADLFLAVREVASHHGVHATFIPKPLEGEQGSGMHVHLSLFRGDDNAFYDADDAYHLSPTAKAFMAGMLHHAAEITAVALPVAFPTDNRVYDGTISSAVVPVVGALFGGDAIGTAATQSFDTKHVGVGKTLSASGLVVSDGNGGNNYAISYVADKIGRASWRERV